jgi:hypothetical protein
MSIKSDENLSYIAEGNNESDKLNSSKYLSSDSDKINSAKEKLSSPSSLGANPAVCIYIQKMNKFFCMYMDMYTYICGMRYI